MSGKVFSVGVHDDQDHMIMTSLASPVRYRVHTSDARIHPEGAECVLWSEVRCREFCGEDHEDTAVSSWFNQFVNGQWGKTA